MNGWRTVIAGNIPPDDVPHGGHLEDGNSEEMFWKNGDGARDWANDINGLEGGRGNEMWLASL